MCYMMAGEGCTSGRLSRTQFLHPLVVLCVVNSHASVRRLHWPVALCKLLLRATCPVSLRLKSCPCFSCCGRKGITHHAKPASPLADGAAIALPRGTADTAPLRPCTISFFMPAHTTVALPLAICRHNKVPRCDTSTGWVK